MPEGFYDLPNQSNIVPVAMQTEYWLCAGIPWDNTYKHVRLFNTEVDLRAYLESKCPSQWGPWHQEQNSPISFGKAKVRVPQDETVLMGINYIMFINKNFANRYFYGFVTDIEWLSDNSAVVTYELDYFQNCAYRATWNPCFVEREHMNVADDTFGANIIPENLETGPIIASARVSHGFGTNNIGILASEQLGGKQVQGALIGNVYQGASLTILQDDEGVSAVALANGLLSNYNDKGQIDAIIDVYMVPEMCRQSATENQVISVNGAFRGYSPKNKKLYTFPYCYVLVDNNCGKTAKYQFEFGIPADGSLLFQMNGSLSPLPAVYLVPSDYMTTGTTPMNSLAYTGFPQCSWNSDVYRAWAAQNKNTLALASTMNALAPVKGGISGAVSGAASGGVVGALTGALTGGLNGAVSGFESEARLMAQQADKEIEPAQVHGNVSNLNLNAYQGLMRFEFYTMSCTYENAKAIDSYFDLYGYATHQVKRPNITGRPSWNFVKTIDCTFTGAFPPDMLQNFRAIFDRGVTIWHTNDVGNYGLNNR